MNRNILLSLLVVLSLFSAHGWSMNSGSLTTFSKTETKAIKARYKLTSDQAIFNNKQGAFIEQEGLAPLIHTLILHKKIKLEDIDDVIDYARQIAESGLEFSALEPRILKNIAKGELTFTALTQAIDREQFHVWHAEIYNRITSQNGEFVERVGSMNLSNQEKRRVLNVYATCIASFRDDNDRQMMKPEICGDIDEYTEPRHVKYPMSIREMHESTPTPYSNAYTTLLSEARTIADTYNLSTFERVIMAKCVAEQSLRFFLPSHHPFKAWHKHRKLKSNSPERSFFMRTGVCSNFSGIAYNAALELGLKGKIHLAKNGVHVYLEFEEEGEWYHAHPFNSKSKCAITRFKSLPLKEI